VAEARLEKKYAAIGNERLLICHELRSTKIYLRVEDLQVPALRAERNPREKIRMYAHAVNVAIKMISIRKIKE